MPTPRVTIDALPEQATPEDTNFLVVQDDDTTKKMSIATLKTLESTALNAHLADTSDAHDASAISSTDSGHGIDSVTVQGQLGQLATLAGSTSDALAIRDVMWVGTDAPVDPLVEVWYDPDEPVGSTPDSPYIDVRLYGATGNGVTDDTAALQAAINAAVVNCGTVLIPVGTYKFSTLTIGGAVTIRGMGCEVTGQPTFGFATFDTYVDGTVLRSTTTTGKAICATASNLNITLADFAVIGPGSGTSIGLALGHPDNGNAAKFVNVRNVKVGNFATGVYLGLENSQIDLLYVLGCLTGILTGNAHNGNAHNTLTIEACTNFGIYLAGADGNTFTGGVLQGNTGTVVAIDASYNNHFFGIYFENASCTNAIHIGYSSNLGDYNSFYGCHMNTFDKTVIATTANCNQIIGGRQTGLITLDGQRNVLIGLFTGTIAGTKPLSNIIFDTNAGVQLGTQNLSVANAQLNFVDASGVQKGRLSTNGTIWEHPDVGGNLTINTGTGGSFLDVKAFALRLSNQAGTRQFYFADNPPADASLANGEIAIWFDQATAKLMFRAKNSGGTAVAANVQLT